MKNMKDHFDKEANKHDSYFIEELGMKAYYDEVEVQLNKTEPKARILVLGCGTGLEVERIKTGHVTAVDISSEMIKKLEAKDLPGIRLETITQSFFELVLDKDSFDLVLTSYAMHHFNEDQKLKLYGSIYKALKPGGVFINGDSMSKNKQEEDLKMAKAIEVYKAKNKPFGSLHLDVHFSYEHELEVLKIAGFTDVVLEREWTKTKLYRAKK